ncbi:hypothetical protein HYX10_03340 [Candidatus Woesearchaeota archaeon]|nr:hypothetical protein [Candidatus Woesearchaeota archaeon]
MSQIVQIKSPVLAAVTDQTGYVNARKEADKLATEYGLKVADMPMAIQAMANHPEVREAIRPDWVDTITGEYHGQRDGDRSYETWHSAGSFATPEGLEKVFSKAGQYTFMQIDDDEWVAVGKGNYNGQDVARIHLDDVKKGRVPAAGTPYTAFTRLDKDKANINGSGQLMYDAFMRDDRVLMIVGSPDNREALAKMLFGRKEDGGEGWSNIGSYHRINEAGFDAQAKGRLVYLGSNFDGLFGRVIYDDGRFVGVAPEAQRADGGQLVRPTLEQVVNVVLGAGQRHVAEATRAGFERDVRETLKPLYQ